MRQPSQAIGTVLVVDDDQALLLSLERALRPLAREVHLCRDRRSAQAFLGRRIPDLLLLDLALPDGDAFDLLKVLHRRYPLPCLLAMSGVATPEQSFRLAQLGVRAYLAKPFTTAELHGAIDRAVNGPLDLRPQLRSVVGQQSLPEVESEVRGTMMREALARADGSRRAAARLLRVSRQLVQHILRKAGGR